MCLTDNTRIISNNSIEDTVAVRKRVLIKDFIGRILGFNGTDKSIPPWPGEPKISNQPGVKRPEGGSQRRRRGAIKLKRDPGKGHPAKSGEIEMSKGKRRAPPDAANIITLNDMELPHGRGGFMTRQSRGTTGSRSIMLDNTIRSTP